MDFSLEWFETSWYGQLIKNSRWGFGIAEVFHLCGMVLLLGGVVLMSLRLTGLTMTDRPIAEIAANVRGWVLTGLAVMLASGVSLWTSDPTRYFEKGWFWFKMVCLVLAIAFHLTAWKKVTHNPKASLGLRFLTAVLALLLWFGVGFGGRAIGFL